jgi:hypothetical protein
MNLWVMLFLVGLLGLTTSSVMIANMKQKVKPTMLFIRDEKGEGKYLIKY